MNSTAIASNFAFTALTRKLGLFSTWMTFALFEIYAVISGMVFVSQGKAVESGTSLAIMSLLVVLMGPFLILSMVSIHAYAPAEKKAYSLAALIFMSACVAITSCTNFMLLIVSSMPDLFSESWQSMFLPCVWPAPAFVLDNFTWDWFFGISMLLAAPIFSGTKLKNGIRLLMFTSGVLCIAGLIWLSIAPAQAIIIGILGWGAAGPFVFLLLANLFTHSKAKPENS
jgi:hypothetical protein